MKTLLLTGASGFLGTNILPSLREGYDVTTLGRREGCDLRCDLVRDVPEVGLSFDVVLHTAGKAHSHPVSDMEVQEYYDTNYKGSVNLCKGLERMLPRQIIYISTTAVYGFGNGVNIDESFPLNGFTHYAKSKIMAEEHLLHWCRSFGVPLVILRPPLILGSNPPENLGAMIKGIRKFRYLSIDGGKARKSMIMASDIARLVPIVEGHSDTYNVCADYSPSFREMERLICRQLHRPIPPDIPSWIGKLLIGEEKVNKITNTLTFSNAKAKRELSWSPLEILDNYTL